MPRYKFKEIQETWVLAGPFDLVRDDREDRAGLPCFYKRKPTGELASVCEPRRVKVTVEEIETRVT